MSKAVKHCWKEGGKRRVAVHVFESPGLSRLISPEHIPQTITSMWILQQVNIPVAAAAAKSLQSCLTLRPHRRQPTRLPRPWDSPGKNTGVGCHFFIQCMKVKSENEVSQSCPTLRDPMDGSLPGSSIHGFSRQEYWSGLTFLVHIKQSIMSLQLSFPMSGFIVTRFGSRTGDYHLLVKKKFKRHLRNPSTRTTKQFSALIWIGKSLLRSVLSKCITQECWSY